MTEVDIVRAAHQMIDLYDREAAVMAGRRADAFFGRGDLDEMQAWVRVLAAIEELQPAAGKDMRHQDERPLFRPGPLPAFAR